MASGAKILFMASIMLIVLQVPILVGSSPCVPCYFIFGDSLVDNGNNNGLESTAKANYPPYGVDFRGGPTGRFTNGRNVADLIAELLGFEDYIPPFATAKGRLILKGVNYASGGAGIRAETGQQLGGRISLDTQLINHQVTISRITDLIGKNDSAKEYLKKCMYTVGMGSNDYLNNYLMPKFYPTSHQYTPDQYAAILVRQYSQQLRTLYNYGARKVAVFGLGNIGCTPAKLALYGTNGSSCVDSINNAVYKFNDRLKPLVDDLNKDLTDAKFIYINLTSISAMDPKSIVSAVTVSNTPCCLISTSVAEGQCVPNQAPCHNRAVHIFWDAFHPSEVSNMVVARRAFVAKSPLDAYPMDIHSLAWT